VHQVGPASAEFTARTNKTRHEAIVLISSCVEIYARLAPRWAWQDEERSMTETNSNDVTPGLSVGMTRRSITRLLGGLALGAPLALLGLNESTGKGKRKKKQKKEFPKFKTVRQPLTLTFRNPLRITIPMTDTGANTGSPADAYPSIIKVNGFTNGRILDVNLTLNGLNHTFPRDIDILLVAPHVPDQNAFVLSDIASGRTEPVPTVTLTLDDQAPQELPENAPLVSGTFRPTNLADGIPDSFPAPAPAPSGNVALSAFTDSDPNGTWQLFIVDDERGDAGSIVGGWSLEITAKADVEVRKQVRAKKRNKHTKQRKS